MRNEDIPKELEDQAIWICKIQKIDILWLKGPFLATAVIYRFRLFGFFLWRNKLGKIDKIRLIRNLKWQGQRAVKVFAVNLDILKNKIKYFWLYIKIYVN